MKTTKRISLATLITITALTGCMSTENNKAAEDAQTTAPSAPTETPETQNGYIEVDGAPYLTEDDLASEELQAITNARQAGQPLYIRGEIVFWLEPNISYPERILVEYEARNTSDNNVIRSVEGFGSGELTFYRHKTTPYTIQVDKQK